MKHAILIQLCCCLFHVRLLPAQLVFSFFEPIIEFAVWHCFYAETASILAVLECRRCDNNKIWPEPGFGLLDWQQREKCEWRKIAQKICLCTRAR